MQLADREGEEVSWEGCRSWMEVAVGLMHSVGRWCAKHRRWGPAVVGWSIKKFASKLFSFQLSTGSPVAH